MRSGRGPQTTDLEWLVVGGSAPATFCAAANEQAGRCGLERAFWRRSRKRRHRVLQIWRVPVMASRSVWRTGEAKRQDDGHRDGKQAGGRCEVTNGRSTAIDDTTSRVEERPSTKRTHDHEREERPPPRPGPLHEETNPEQTGPTSSKGDADNERRDENSFELIRRASVESDPECREAECRGHERQSRGQHRSAARSPGHARQIAGFCDGKSLTCGVAVTPAPTRDLETESTARQTPPGQRTSRAQHAHRLRRRPAV
jgi:hypothetical protein